MLKGKKVEFFEPYKGRRAFTILEVLANGRVIAKNKNNKIIANFDINGYTLLENTERDLLKEFVELAVEGKVPSTELINKAMKVL